MGPVGDFLDFPKVWGENKTYLKPPTSFKIIADLFVL